MELSEIKQKLSACLGVGPIMLANLEELSASDTKWEFEADYLTKAHELECYDMDAAKTSIIKRLGLKTIASPDVLIVPNASTLRFIEFKSTTNHEEGGLGKDPVFQLLKANAGVNLEVPDSLGGTRPITLEPKRIPEYVTTNLFGKHLPNKLASTLFFSSLIAQEVFGGDSLEIYRAKSKLPQPLTIELLLVMDNEKHFTSISSGWREPLKSINNSFGIKIQPMSFVRFQQEYLR